jgi:hypothetical protein
LLQVWTENTDKKRLTKTRTEGRDETEEQKSPVVIQQLYV